MAFDLKIFNFLIIFLLILFSGCTEISPAPKPVNVNIVEKTPVLLNAPQVISRSGYYQIAEDLVPADIKKSKTGTCVCFNIQTSDAVIDGMGHAIDGRELNRSCSYLIGFSLWGGRDSKYGNVIIRNVTVTNWTDGVQLGNAYNLEIKDAELKGNSHVGIEVHSSSDIIIRNNSIHNNRIFGIVGMDNEKIFISNNSIADNSHYGMNIMGRMLTQKPLVFPILGWEFLIFPDWYSLERQTSGGNYVISRNRIEHNKNSGISVSDSDSDIIAENYIDGNGQSGISLIGVENSVIRNNSIFNHNEVGIRSASRGLNLVLENNTFSGNKEKIQTMYSTSNNLPTSAIIGTLVILLISILNGTTTVTSKFVANRIMVLSKYFRRAEETMSAMSDSLGISPLITNNIIITLIGVIFLGFVFTVVNKAKFGLTLENFMIFSFLGGTVLVAPKILQYLAGRKSGMEFRYRLWWTGIVMALFMIPTGQIFGLPVRTAVENEEVYEKKKMAFAMGIAPLFNLIPAVIFFIIYQMKGPVAPYVWVGLTMSLMGAMVSSLPFMPAEGARVYRWNRLAWLGLLLIAAGMYGFIVIPH